MITLVVPLKNESRTIAELWNSINEQSYPPEAIIFVDGGSSDGTVEQLKNIELTDKRVTVITWPGAMPGVGRNVGIAHATTEWIALTDGGIILCRDWLEQLVRIASANPLSSIVYGNYEPIVDSFLDKCAVLTYVAPKTLRNDQRMRGPFIASCMLKRSLWREIGGFPDSRAGEDLVFMNRVEELGYEVAWAPLATVMWRLRPDLISTYKRFALYSKHNVWIGMQRHWHYGVARQYMIVIFFFLLALIHSPFWLLSVVTLFAFRTVRSVYRRTETKRMLEVLNPFKMIGVFGMILVIDLATFVGWFNAITSGREVGTDGRAE